MLSKALFFLCFMSLWAIKPLMVDKLSPLVVNNQ